MTKSFRFGLLEVLLLLAVLAGAGACRFLYLYKYTDRGAHAGPMRVQDDKKQEIESLVENLRKGKGFVAVPPLASAKERMPDQLPPTAYTAPGYPWLLAQLARFGDDWPLKARWAQLALGTLTAGIYFLFALRAFRSTFVALLTGTLCAVYPFWIINTADINDGVMVTFALGLCLLLGAWGGESGGVLTSLLYGLGLAGLSLVRGAMLPFAFAGMLWYLLRCRSLPRGWFYALLSFLGFGVGIAPWTVRNVQVLKEPLPIVDSTMYHVWLGNNGKATGGPQTDKPVDGQPAETELRMMLRREFGIKDTDSLPDSATARARLLREATWNNMKNDPARTWLLRIKAGLYFFFGEDFFQEGNKLWQEIPFESAKAEDVSRHKIAVAWWKQITPTLLYASIFGMLVFAVLGWRWSYGWRYTVIPASLAAVWVPLPYIFSHAESLSGPRLPLDGVFITFAAFAIGCLVPGLGYVLFRGRPAGVGGAEVQRSIQSEQLPGRNLV